jgi:hypothetical protein
VGEVARGGRKEGRGGRRRSPSQQPFKKRKKKNKMSNSPKEQKWTNEQKFSDFGKY